MLSIVVGEDIQIPENFVKLGDQKALKDSYIEFMTKLENEKRTERKGKRQAQVDYDEEDESEEEEESEDGD
jgi:hypothetical protein